MDPLVLTLALLSSSAGLLLLVVGKVVSRERQPAEPELDRRMGAFLGHPTVPYEAVVLTGTPEVGIEARSDTGWNFVARWPPGLTMRARQPDRQGWPATVEAFWGECGTVTPWALEQVRSGGAWVSLDGLRMGWTVHEADPHEIVAHLRRLWSALVDPPPEALAAAVLESDRWLRAANLRTLHHRAPDHARRVAANVGSELGADVFGAALEVRGDAAEIVSYATSAPTPEIRAVAFTALARIGDPDLLPIYASVARSHRLTARAFAAGLTSRWTPARLAWAEEAAATGFTAWDADGAVILANALARHPTTNEPTLIHLLSTPAASQAAVRLELEGTPAAVLPLRAAADRLGAEVAESAIRAIQNRAAGERGGLTVVDVAGGAVSVAEERGGRLSAR